MFESIKKVKEQLGWDPVIQPGKPTEAYGIRHMAYGKIIICGMGGSNIASGFLEMLRPDLEVVAHRSYGLPANAKKDDLVIISSYSGNTEEALDSFEKALIGEFGVVVITTGGKLLELAKEKNIPYIQMPQNKIEPRMALGYSLLAILKAIGDEENIKKVQEFGENFNPEELEEEGRVLAEKLNGKTPIIYSSWNNKAIAYAWKVKFNETAKIQTFFNVFPELNHNEMIGFLSQNAPNYSFIFLKDVSDHQRIQKRMDITQKMLNEKSFNTDVLNLEKDVFEKIFNSLAVADWASYHLAQNSGFDPEDSSIIEEFKNKMSY